MRPPPHFKPFDASKKIEIYRRDLPHWRQDSATYFVTFRLHDSVPEPVSLQLRKVSAEIQGSTDDEVTRTWFRIYDEALDHGHGSCLLKFPTNRRLVRDALLHFEGTRYQLGSFVIMPNHVHLIIQPTEPDRYPLDRILKTIKAYSSRQINLAAGTTGSKVWQTESHDRILRGSIHLNRAIQYIGRNPEKAKLGRVHSERWINSTWEAAGWGFRGNRMDRG